jgi:uncharacterized protein YoxC
MDKMKPEEIIIMLKQKNKTTNEFSSHLQDLIKQKNELKGEAYTKIAKKTNEFLEEINTDQPTIKPEAINPKPPPEKESRCQ